MIDTSSPISGRVSDGASIDQDAQFTSDTSAVAVTWTGFDDQESNVDTYRVDVYRTPPGKHEFWFSYAEENHFHVNWSHLHM